MKSKKNIPLPFRKSRKKILKDTHNTNTKRKIMKDIPKKTLPLVLCYNSPYGTFSNKELTHTYSLGTKLYTNIDNQPTETTMGSVIFRMANAPTHNPNLCAIAMTIYFSIYNKDCIFGSILCTTCFQTALNLHGIFQDGDFTFCVLYASDMYEYLMPSKDKYTELKINIKHGIATLTIPPNNDSKINIPKPKLDVEELKKKMEPIAYYLKVDSNHNPLINHVHDYFTESILYEKHEYLNKLEIGENCGHFMASATIIDSHIDSTRKDSVAYILYSINNLQNRKGNVIAFFPVINIPCTQKGAWSSTPSNNLRVGHIIYADDDFSYLSPNNNPIPLIAFVLIDPATLDRVLYFPKKPEDYKEPSFSEIPNSKATHTKFYTGVPTIIGGELSNENPVSKYSVGATIPKSNKLVSDFSYRKFSVYADIYDTDTNEYIGIGIFSNYSSYINEHPFTWCIFSAIFNDGTFLNSNTISNDELQSNGSTKETTEAGTYIIHGCSRNYGNAVKITRISKIEPGEKNDKVKRYYTVWKPEE